jgi:hypothetical protein
LVTSLTVKKRLIFALESLQLIVFIYLPLLIQKKKTIAPNPHQLKRSGADKAMIKFSSAENAKLKAIVRESAKSIKITTSAVDQHHPFR